jgi:hypothetical protein
VSRSSASSHAGLIDGRATKVVPYRLQLEATPLIGSALDIGREGILAVSADDVDREIE